MKDKKAQSGVRIERPRTGADDLDLARWLHDEVIDILSQQQPEETLEEVMTRLRG